MDQIGVDSMVSTACIGMNRELAALRQTNLSKVFSELIDMFIRTRQRIVQHDSALKTGISSHNVIVAHLSNPTLPDDAPLKDLEDELKDLQTSLDKITESINVLQKDRVALADARARYHAEQASKQRKDRQRLAEMRSLLGFYQNISNVYWDSDQRCFFLSPEKSRLISFSNPDDKFKLLEKDNNGKNMCIWDLLTTDL